MITSRSIYILILLFMLFIINIEAQQTDREYDFPLKPGMPEWKELQTHSEMTKTLQLPANVIKSMSTASLLKTCINYPLFSDMWAYDNIKEGFEQLRKDFNGFNELYKRKDALKELLKLYNNMNPGKISEKSSLLEKGRYTAEFCKVEMLLSQPELMKNSIQDTNDLLLEEVVKKHEEMLKYSEFDIRSIESNIFLMGNVLVSTDFSSMLRINKNVKVNNFIKTSMFIDKEIILEILSLSKEYLNKK